jgi:hypothetical protein
MTENRYDEVEFGQCVICGKSNFLQRTYFKFDLQCACHSSHHFELVIHCKNCIPIMPKTTIAVFETKDLKML